MTAVMPASAAPACRPTLWADFDGFCPECPAARLRSAAPVASEKAPAQSISVADIAASAVSPPEIP